MRALILCACLLQVLACSRPDNRTSVVRVTGASTVYPIVSMAAEPLKRDYNIRLDVQAGGSTRGFNDNLAGLNDLGAMARELTEEEAQQVVTFPIAHDGVGITVHRNNDVAEITTEQLRQIYRKELVNWQELGGKDAAIVVVNKAEGHATLESFLNHTQLTREDLEVDVVAGDNAQVIRAVANTPNAIGYVSMSEVIQASDAGMPVKLIELDAVAPTLENVANGRFPMFRTLYLISKDQPGSAAQTLIDFLRGPEGKKVIEKGKYVPYR